MPSIQGPITMGKDASKEDKDKLIEAVRPVLKETDNLVQIEKGVKK